MRFFRLMAMGVVLLVLVGGVLGTACAGAKGEQGPQGETGATGATGPAGPQGIQGPQGMQGIQGIQGEKGDTGPAGVGIVWQGEWSNSTAYSRDDAVGYQGSSYISKQDSNINHVPTDADWWDLWGATGPQGPQGEKGDKGDTGDQGPQGIQGEPGPNMIVAMGNILADGTISRGYNVAGVTWDTANLYYQIALTGITYSSNHYVTLITPGGDFIGRYESLSGNLLVYIYDLSGRVQGPFSFIVLATP